MHTTSTATTIACELKADPVAFAVTTKALAEANVPIHRCEVDLDSEHWHARFDTPDPWKAGCVLDALGLKVEDIDEGNPVVRWLDGKARRFADGVQDLCRDIHGR